MYTGHVGDYHRPRCRLCVVSADEQPAEEELVVFTRTLGRSGLEVSALGLGTWAIGGPLWDEQGRPVGWGYVDDAESIRAIHRGLELGVTFWDTADVYGTGHSERLLGLGLAGARHRVVIATKFGRVFAEGSRQIIGRAADPAYIRRACEESLRRLNTDYIDLYQFHLGDYNLERALEDPALQAAKAAIDLILTGHEPYPALAVDRHWTLLAANAAVAPLLALVVDAELLRPPVNVLRLALHPGGLAAATVNFDEWRAHILARLRQQVRIAADPVLADLLAELLAYPASSVGSGSGRVPMPVVEPAIAVPLRLRVGDGVLSFISTTTVFGTPVDITLSELALETFFPADAATGAALRALAQTRRNDSD